MLKTYTEQLKRPLSKFETLSSDAHCSIFEGLSLSHYVFVRSFVCNKNHKKPCDVCTRMIWVAKTISVEGFLKLKTAFEMVSPTVTYTALHARRKLLQMPLVSIGVGDRQKGSYCVFLVEKQGAIHYTIFQSLLNNWLSCQNKKALTSLSKETVSDLLKLAESNGERERLKYAIVKAAGISHSQAKNVYGFDNVSSRVNKVENALLEATAIRDAIENIANIKETAILSSLGINETSDESQSESMDDESETDTDNSENEIQPSDLDDARETVSIAVETERKQLDCTQTHLDIPSEQQLCDVLRCCNLNWIEFVRVVTGMIENKQSEVVENVLSMFAENLPQLDFSNDERNLIDQSRQAYSILEHVKEKEADVDDGLIVSDSDGETMNDLFEVKDPLDTKGMSCMLKRRKGIRCKAKRAIATRIAERRFLQKRRSKRIGTIQKQFPGIGNTIEEFVRKQGVGADSWRRTGVLTFDGNRRVGRKVTFRTIQEHLQAKYKRKFGYGTVVQLCVPRNKRRKSAARYKGLAQVTHRRARKGFNLKYNPDDHWSSALYRGLDYIQYKDGRNIMNVGRDDQSGFRLDTMATSKQHATICLKDNLPLTTRTDYVNPYPSVLQTTSYNFAATETTIEVCAGVVKAKPLFPKNPAQHFADMLLIEENEDVKPAFLNPTTGNRKEIECIRVDGASDEGLVHEEVQYWWTKRHLVKATKAMLISTRSSGSSFKNRVELQNGCLALAHANLFIPSTLNGSCMESGKINNKLLCKNLDSAIDIYISRVDKAPCARTVLHIMKGAESKDLLTEREMLLTFLKGKVQEKKKAELNNPNLYQEVKKVWELRAKHMVPGLPHQYIFMLKCCFSPTCVHPFCKSNAHLSNNEDFWYPGGPSLNFFPFPTPDPDRPYGNNECAECSGFCAGHYMKPSKLISYVKSAGQLSEAIPPSQVLLKAYKSCAGFPSDVFINAIAKEVLLKPENVKMWFRHLEIVDENRRKGAIKAAATRKAKKDKAMAADVLLESDEDEDEVCNICYSLDPPGTSIEESVIDWLACNECALWYHTKCVGIYQIPDVWQCNACVR